MRKAVPGLAVAAALLSPARAQDGPLAFDVTACDISMEIVPPRAEAAGTAPGEGVLRARASIAVRRGSPLVRTLVFRLNGALRVQSVLDGSGNALPFVVREGGFLQRVEIEAPTSPAASGGNPPEERVTLAYEGPLRATVGDVTLALIEKDRAFAFAASGWYPLANVSDHFVATVTAKVPKSFVFVSNGTPALVGADDESRTVRCTETKPVVYLSFAAGNYTIRREQHRGLDLSVCLYRDDTALAERYLAEMKRILDFYGERFGPYPFSGLAIVEVDDRFALPRGTSALVLVTSSFLNDRFPDRFSDELRVIAHEIAHQWWANLVAIRSADDHWLNEGFAEYSALLYHEWRDGPDRLRSYLRRVAAIADLPGIGGRIPLARGSELSTGPALAYAAAKGAYVLHMLRMRLGDERFFALLRAYVTRFAFGRASTGDFVALASQFAGSEGDDLSAFFAQWVLGTAIPDLSVAFSVSQPPEGGFRLRGEVGGMPAGFRTPVELRFEGSLQELRMTVDCAQARTPFEAQLGFLPERVCLDPEGKLLRRPQPARIEEALLDADALFFFKRYEEARARYRDVLAMDPYEPHALFGLGRAWLALGEAEPAKAALARVDPDLLTAERHVIAWSQIDLGIALDRLGQRDAAKAAYARALRTGDNTNGARDLAEEGIRKPMPDHAVR